jgi:aspartyl-tRNA(Asn)/glutamyl-tRNA(Gln) amidotransferase subunit C
MLTDKEVDHIASLARLELDEKTRERMKQDLSSILDYIKVLQSVPTDQVSPLYQTTGQTDRTRADEHRGDLAMDEGRNEQLVGQAPSREGQFMKVRSVMSKNKKA